PPEAGPWLILIHSYTEPNAPSLARALALELRGENFRLPAYVWNYGEKERKEELERVRQERERQKELIQQARRYLPPDAEVAPVPIRVQKMLLRVQCAVLVGGYRDVETARRELERLRKLSKDKPLDAKRFQLPQLFIGGPGKVEGNKVEGNVELATVNPFL